MVCWLPCIAANWKKIYQNVVYYVEDARSIYGLDDVEAIKKTVTLTTIA